MGGSVSKSSDVKETVVDSDPKKKLNDSCKVKTNNGRVDDENQDVQNIQEEVFKVQCTSSNSKEKFNTACNILLNNVAVDFDKQEVKDIQDAVLEMLTRIQDGLNKRGLFKVSRLLPVGSMRERTGLLYGTNSYLYPVVVRWYLEFDFLAVLKVPKSMNVYRQTCDSCMTVSGDALSNLSLQELSDLNLQDFSDCDIWDCIPSSF